MKIRYSLFVFIGILTFGCSEKPDATTESEHVADYIQYVNPIIGTNGMGHTFPGACAPFGIVQLSPDTDTVPSMACTNLGCMSIALAISTKTALSWASATRISVVQGIPT